VLNRIAYADAAWSDPTSEDNSCPHEEACAVSALAFAGRDNSIESATEAIYEAATAIDDGQVLNAVFSVLSEI